MPIAATDPVQFAVEQYARPGRVELRMLEGPEAPRSFELQPGRISFGRGHAADERIDSPSMSKRHFELRVDEWVEVHDLGSRNGLWFNEARVLGGLRLRPGQEFRAGGCRFELARVDQVEVEALVTDRFHGLYGDSPVMRTLYRRLERIGQSPPELSVLLLGETGVGKELCARAIHAIGGADRPFRVLDCGSLSAPLVEATLFGVRKGAYTGAGEDREGLFEQASGGTLLIDELGELPLELQTRLLRVLDDGRIKRVGEASYSARVELRVIAATHRDLGEAVSKGRFRRDLYHRLKLASVHVPPLRERREDIPQIARHVVREVERRRECALQLTPNALEALHEHDWPGNVRELCNVVRTAGYLCEGPYISREDLEISQRVRREGETLEQEIHAARSLPKIIARVELMYLARVYELCGGNVSEVARRIECGRAKARKMLIAAGLHPESGSKG